MTKPIVASIGLLFASHYVLAQSPSVPKLEVASIREVSPGSNYSPLLASYSPLLGGCGTGSLKISGNRVIVSRVTVCALIKIAYSLRDHEVTGAPNWATKEGSPTGYEIQAIAEGSEVLTREGASVLLQVLLKDRFQLEFHNETRELSVYALVVDRGGPKFTDEIPSRCVATGDKISSIFRIKTSGDPFLEYRPGMLSYCRPTSINNFARMLSLYVDRPVINKTGLTGGYVFELKWDGPSSLFSELPERLGLRLVARKEPVEVMVIDRIQRPSTN